MSATYAGALYGQKTKKGKSKEALPEPLCSPKRHPVRFMRQKVAMVGTSAVLTYLGVLIVAALYYLILETYAPITKEWHTVVPNGELRHNIRDVGEGLFGGLLGHMIIWNHYKKSLKKPRNWLDKIEIALYIPNVKDERRLTGWMLLAVVPLVLLYALPGFFLAEWVIHLIKPATVVGEGTSVWDQLKGVVTENYPQKIIGYAAAFFFGRRPAKAIFDDLQLWMAERRLVNGKDCHWYHVPTFKARFNEACKRGRASISNTSHWWMRALIVVGILLALYGFYVVNFIAKHQHLGI